MKKLPSKRRNIKRAYYLSPQKAINYTVEFLTMLLLFSVKDYGFSLALALLVGLSYAKQNILILTPLFIVAGCVFLHSWWTLLFLAIPSIVLCILFFAFYKLKRNVPKWSMILCGVICTIPNSVFNLLIDGDILVFALSLTLCSIFALSCTTGCYAVLIRGIKCRFTLDESICLGAICIAFAYALTVDIYGFSLVYFVFPFVIMSCTFSKNSTLTLVVGLLFGVGCSLAKLSFLPLAEFVLLTAIEYGVSVLGRYVSALLLAVVELVLWLLACGSWQGGVLLAVGGLIYCLLPSTLRNRFIKRVEDKAGLLCSIVNRDRGEMSEKLLSVGNVFADMSSSLSLEDNAVNPYTPKRLAKEVAQNYCSKCSEHPKCFSALGGDTAPVIEPLAEGVLGRGKATILDVPNFITSHCVKTHNLIGVVNNVGEGYRAKIACAGDIINTKKLMSEQFAGMALVLDSLADECGKNLSFGGGDEEKLTVELLKHNIVADEVLIAGEGENAKVALTVREIDATKAILPRIVSRCLQARFAVNNIEKRGDYRTVHLVSSPIFEVAYGIAGKKRDGEDVSGDTCAVLSPSLTKRIFALSDGMGSGNGANKIANTSINMIENFYKAGFDDNLILSIINKLLCISDDNRFSAIDISIVDTKSGGVDIIKMGASSGFIVRKNSVEVVKSCALPAGVFDKASPTTARYQLYDGDMLISATDGVIDAIGESGIIDVVERLNTTNPQTLADGILVDAMSNGANDDCTVMAMRLLAV